MLLLFFAIVPAAYAVEFEKIPIIKAKANFLELYKNHWELFGVKDKLDEIIDLAIDEQLEKFFWGTSSFQLAWHGDEIIPKIQQAAGLKFSPIYEKFLAELEITWSEILAKNILEYYEKTSDKLAYEFELDENPMIQAHLRQDYDTVTKTGGILLIKNLANDLSKKYGTSSNFGLKAAIGAGLLLNLGVKMLSNKLAASAGRKLASSAAGKIITGVTGISTIIMVAWAAWDVYSITTTTEQTVRKSLHEMNQSMYTREIPEAFWDAMQPYVNDAFIMAYERLQTAVDRGNELKNDPIIKELEFDLNRIEKRFFADRIAILDDALSNIENFNKKNLFMYFGKYIRDSSVKDFETIVLMLRQGDWESLKIWIDLIGFDECCKIFNENNNKFWADPFFYNNYIKNKN